MTDIEKAILDLAESEKRINLAENKLDIQKIRLSSSFIGSIGHSELYRCKLNIDGKIQDVVIKKAEEDEYNNMVFLWENFYKHEKQNRIPEPFYFLDKHSLLFVEYVFGKNMKATVTPSLYYFSSKSKFNFSKSLLKKSANWLVVFENKLFDNKYLSKKEYVEYINNSIDNLLNIDKKFKSEVKEKILILSKNCEEIPIKFSNKCFRMRDMLHNQETLIRLDWGRWLSKNEHPLFIELSSLITEIRELLVYPHINPKKVMLLENAFITEFWSKSNLSIHKNIFPLIHIYYSTRYLNSLIGKSFSKNFIRKILINRRIKVVKNTIREI